MDDCLTQDMNLTQTVPEQPVAFLGTNGTEYPLINGPNKIGRVKDVNNIYLDFASISRQHAIIVINSEKVTLMDMNSRNKTKLGMTTLRPYSSYPVSNGDVIQFGDVIAVFRLYDAYDDLPITPAMTQDMGIPETPVSARSNSRTVTIPETPDHDDSINSSRDEGQDSTVFLEPNKPAPKSKTSLRNHNSITTIPTTLNFDLDDSKQSNVLVSKDKSIDNLDTQIPYEEYDIFTTETQLPLDCLNRVYKEPNLKISNEKGIYDSDTQLPIAKVDTFNAETQLPLGYLKKELKESNVTIPIEKNNHDFDNQLPIAEADIFKVETQLPPGNSNKELKDSNDTCRKSIEKNSHDFDTQSNKKIVSKTLPLNITDTVTKMTFEVIDKKTKNETEQQVFDTDCDEFFNSIESQSILPEKEYIINNEETHFKPKRIIENSVLEEAQEKNIKITFNQNRQVSNDVNDDLTDCEDEFDDKLVSKNMTVIEEENDKLRNFEDLPTQVICNITNKNVVSAKSSTNIDSAKEYDTAKDENILSTAIDIEDLPTQILENKNVVVSESIKELSIKNLDNKVNLTDLMNTSARIKSAINNFPAEKNYLLCNDVDELDQPTQVLDKTSVEDLPIETLERYNLVVQNAKKKSSNHLDQNINFDKIVSGSNTSIEKNKITKEIAMKVAQQEQSTQQLNKNNVTFRSHEVKPIQILDKNKSNISIEKNKKTIAVEIDRVHQPVHLLDKNDVMLQSHKVKVVQILDKNKSNISVKNNKKTKEIPMAVDQQDQPTQLLDKNISFQSHEGKPTEILNKNKSISLTLRAHQDSLLQQEEKLKQFMDDDENNYYAATQDVYNDLISPQKITTSIISPGKNNKLVSNYAPKRITTDVKKILDLKKPRVLRSNSQQESENSKSEQKKCRVAKKNNKSKPATKNDTLVENEIEGNENMVNVKSGSITNRKSKKEKNRDEREKLDTLNRVQGQSSNTKESEVRRSDRKRKANKMFEDYENTENILIRRTRAQKSKSDKTNHEESAVYNTSKDSSLCVRKKPDLVLDIGPNNKKTKKYSQDKYDSTEKASTTITKRRKQTYVLFSCLQNDKIKEKISELGAVVVEDVKSCTVLATERLLRTFKIMCALGLGKPIVGPSWIQACADAHMILDPWQHLMVDIEGEKKLRCNLKEALAAKRNFLQGYNVSSTPSVLPLPRDMQVIVECSGGVWKEGGPRWLCVCATADHALVPEIKSRGAILISRDAFLGSIMRQRLEFN